MTSALVQARAERGLLPFAPQELFAPRCDLGDGVYSAPEWASDREMCHHHEGSYGITYPDLLLMTTLRAPDGGGVLLLSDTAAVLSYLPSSLVSRFQAAGWLLTRTFRPYLGLAWPTAFGTSDRDEVCELLDARKIEYAWAKDGTLTTRQHRPAIVTHPVDGVQCWFNDIAFFSQWALDRAERDVLLKTFGAEGFPFNTFAGDGSPLTPDDFQALLDAYDAAGRRVTLPPGELLVVDNVRTAHGREPYTGVWDLAIAPACRPAPDAGSPGGVAGAA
jgi:alpha-ketoglutarate-dependent taurine dioxygenase